ncbi:MAG: histidine kinase dimerization/phosphoacceptor domain -containing protein [Balneola sp.]
MSNIKLLLLEDNELDAELTLRVLNRMEHSFDTKIISTKPEFEQTVKDWSPDLIISDFNLQTFSGDEALAVAKKTSPDIPFITLSGSITRKMELTLLEERANDVLTKDNLRRLPFVINRVLNEKQDKEKLRSTLHELEGNLKFQEALAEISIRFNSSESFDLKLKYALEVLGKAAKVSRVYLFEDFEQGKFCRNTFEWCAEGVKPQIHELQSVCYAEDIPSWKPYLIKEGSVFSSNIEELPKDIRDILEPQNIKAVIAYPVQLGNEYIGFIGFDEVRNTRDWTASEDKLLKSVSGIISNALSEKRAKDALQASNIKLSSLLKEKEVLVGEVHHRVKNNLALISSFLQLEQLGVVKSESVEQIITSNILRIKSISIVHETVYQQGTFLNIEVLQVLDQIISVGYLEKVGIKRTVKRIGSEKPVTFNINSAVPFALLLSEIMYQILSSEHAETLSSATEVVISASKNKKLLTVIIQEPNLAKLVENLKKEDGFSEVIEVLAKQIDAKVKVDSEKGSIKITFSDKDSRGSSSTLNS